MSDIAHTGTPLLYAGFKLLALVLLVVDFVALKAQGSHKVAVRKAAIVTLVGVKMLVMDWWKVPVPGMLAAVGTPLLGSVAASLLAPRRAAGPARP